MQLDNNAVGYLVKIINQLENMVETAERGQFRIVARSEAAKLVLALGGWGFDEVRRNAFKLTQREKREYFDASYKT